MSVTYCVEHLLLSDGWASPGYVEVDEGGMISAAGSGKPAGAAERLEGYVVPGMPNLHSHVHQRGLVGWADLLSSGSQETLWTWRKRMYEQVQALTPDHLEALAAQAYVEMVKAGFTSVGEFHYVHHDQRGHPYDNPAELSERIVNGARRAGIGLTIAPALYTSGGVGREPEPEQRRFLHSLDRYVDLIETLRSGTSSDGMLAVATAPHSLRAVKMDELHALLDDITEGPVHIHVSERREEVEEIQAGLGDAPVRWLLDNVDVGPRWSLIHATHTDKGELEGIARCGAVVGLCPLTEANLGDGIFSLAEYSTLDGRWGIGTDANHLIDLTGELRIAEYGQRLSRERRDNVVGKDDTSVARVLFSRALVGGAQALDQPVGEISAGKRADLVELDPTHPAFAGQTAQTALDAWVFSSAGNSLVRNVMVAGDWVVREGLHEAEEDILDSFRKTMQELHGT